MGNHKKYRIKSLYDNIMAVRTVWQLARHRTLFRMRAMQQGLRMQITQGISLTQPTGMVSLSLTNYAPSNWMQRTIPSHSFAPSLCTQEGRHRRMCRPHYFARAMRQRLISLCRNFVLVLSLLCPYTDRPRFFPAMVTTGADADATALFKEV